MRLCRSSQADMNGLTYSAANLVRSVKRSCSCCCDHVQIAHSPIATGMSHCMGDSSFHSCRSCCLVRNGNGSSEGCTGVPFAHLRQEFTFSPSGTTFERENWSVPAEGVTHLR